MSKTYKRDQNIKKIKNIEKKVTHAKNELNCTRLCRIACMPTHLEGHSGAD